MRGAFAEHLAEGFERVVLVDSDSPTLPGQILEDACQALDQHDVTLGPTSDGGYYLIGMHRFHAQLFEGITWSTPRVYAQTLAQATGLRVLELPEWFDVDVPADLERLRIDLERLPEHMAPRTRRALVQGSFRSGGQVFGGLSGAST